FYGGLIRRQRIFITAHLFQRLAASEIQPPTDLRIGSRVENLASGFKPVQSFFVVPARVGYFTKRVEGLSFQQPRLTTASNFERLPRFTRCLFELARDFQGECQLN